LACVALADQGGLDALCLGFVAAVLAQLAVRPVRQLLVGLLAQLDRIGDITHIANHDGARLPLDRHPHKLARDFVFAVAGALLLLAQETVDAALNTLVASGASFTAALEGTQFPQALLRILPLAAQFPASDGTLTVRDSFIVDNFGSGIAQKDGSAVISNTLILGNTADRPGAGVSGDGAARLTIVDSLISNNYARSGDSFGFGGGVAVTSYGRAGQGSLLIRNTAIISNAASSGGGIYLYHHGGATLIDTRVISNSASSGGGIEMWYSVLTATNSLIGDNHAEGSGGGILMWDHAEYLDHPSSLALQGSRLSGNIAGQNGGGIGVYGMPGGGERYRHALEIAGTSILSNTALNGGGIYGYFSAHTYTPTGSPTITASLALNNSVMSGNRAQEKGGGLYHELLGDGGAMADQAQITRTVALRNSTISGNSAAQGGGIYELASGAGLGPSASLFAMHNVTLSANRASEQGGGLLTNTMSGTVRAANSILAGNSAPTGADCAGTLASQGYNLIQSTAGCAITGTRTGNLTGIGPRLGALAANGSATSSHALLANSPAIDAGNVAGCRDEAGALLTRDQRGRARPQDGNEDGTTHCDIGAYELAPPPKPQAYVPVLLRR
jgi:hypothetical protein